MSTTSTSTADQCVTAFHVSSGNMHTGIDYDRLVQQFGTERIGPEIVDAIEYMTVRPVHRFLRRGLFYSHRDLLPLLQAHARGEPFYLYTGRGPSSQSMHLGHLVPFLFTRYLQEVFRVPLVIQLTDDEKYFVNAELTLEQSYANARENIRDIIACGFELNRTFIFSNLKYVGHMYENIVRIQRCLTFRQVQAAFGVRCGHGTQGESEAEDSDNLGKIGFVCVQAAPSFSTSFPGLFPGDTKPRRCLIPCGVDQDVYFRLTRHVASKLGCPKPALIHSKFFPSLLGVHEKMSSSVPASTIFLTDTPTEIASKINKSFSGGGRTLEEHRANGANLDVDIAYQYLTYFLEDDHQLQDLGTRYANGECLSKEVKQTLIGVLTDLVTQHQQRRAAVTDDMIDQYMSVREMEV